MRTYYVQIQCYYRDSFGKIKESFIEEGILDDHGEYLVYRDLNGNTPDVYKSMSAFKKDLVWDLRMFSRYAKLLELK